MDLLDRDVSDRRTAMADQNADARLSQIQTLWTVICQAHGDGPDEAVRAAQIQLMDRYGKVVQRYLLGALRDPHAAEELTQEFALRFVRGDLKGADRERGRFRDFLKGTLFHLIGDFHRRKKKDPLPLEPDQGRTDADSGSLESDRRFLESWRSELLEHAWKSLAALQQETSQPFHSVLQFRARNPEMRSTEMAEQLSQELGRPVNAPWVRQTLHRAREKFAAFLVDDVQATLESPTIQQLEDELIILGLHGYCQPVLEELRAG
jgi:DNA-directed RNA polymerase specialized sigma24 family protein